MEKNVPSLSQELIERAEENVGMFTIQKEEEVPDFLWEMLTAD